MLKQIKLNQKKSSGFTLIELAVTLAIAGVLTYYAIPAYNDFAQRQALSNEANNLLSDLGFARSLAIENGSSVTVTPTIPGGVGPVLWENGWSISETLADGTLSVVRTQAALSNNVSIISAVGTGNVIYNSIGALSTPVTMNFTIQINPDYLNFISVNIMPSGLASSNRDAYGH